MKKSSYNSKQQEQYEKQRRNIISDSKRTILIASLIVVFDAIIFLIWFIAFIYPVITYCRGIATIDHFLSLFHFMQTVSLLGIIDDWKTEMVQNKGYITHKTPYFWIGASTLCFFTDLTLLINDALSNQNNELDNVISGITYYCQDETRFNAYFVFSVLIDSLQVLSATISIVIFLYWIIWKRKFNKNYILHV